MIRLPALSGGGASACCSNLTSHFGSANRLRHEDVDTTIVIDIRVIVSLIGLNRNCEPIFTPLFD
jgi:hypothetical protein